MNFATKLTIMPQQIALIDNEDSFTYNLVQILSESKLCDISVFNASKINVSQIANFDKILISPGAGIPSERPILSEIIDKYHVNKPILGICLGLQAIAEYFGAKLINLPKVFHGYKENVKILNIQNPLFYDISENMEVGLYHSWAVSEENFPNCITIDAISDSNIIMALSHKEFCVYGLQFHPESYICKVGKQIIINWLRINID